MTPPRIPLGFSEDQRNEFKSRDALDDLYVISREVAAMLNTEQGGTVWVGVGEEGGRAVRLESIADAEAAVGRLRDHLLDSIEPSPRGREVEVRTVDAEEGGTLIAVTVRPDAKRRPYAQMKRTARYFLTRVGDRIRPMTREELINALPAEESHDPDQPLQDVLAKREEARGKGGLWLFLKPVERREVDVQDPQVDEFLRDPTKTENRIDGWNFANPYEKPRFSSGKIAQTRGGGAGVEIHRSGEIVFRVPMRDLHWKGEEREIWPYCLLEYPTSVFRLASAVYRRAGVDEETELLADLAIFGLGGWTLRPFSPRAIGYMFAHRSRYEEKDLILPNSPIRLTVQDLIRSPDRIAYRLLVLVYEAFSYPENRIPSEFDRASGRLEMPA